MPEDNERNAPTCRRTSNVLFQEGTNGHGSRAVWKVAIKRNKNTLYLKGIQQINEYSNCLRCATLHTFIWRAYEFSHNKSKKGSRCQHHQRETLNMHANVHTTTYIFWQTHIGEAYVYTHNYSDSLHIHGHACTEQEQCVTKSTYNSACTLTRRHVHASECTHKHT